MGRIGTLPIIATSTTGASTHGRPCTRHTRFTRYLRVAVTGGTSGLGLALVGELLRAARASPSSRARRAASKRRGAATRRARHRRRRRATRTTSIRSRCRSLRQLGGLDVLVNNASSLGPGAARAAGRHRVRGPRAGAGDEPARPVPPDQGAARRARRVGARGTRRASCSTSRATPRSTRIRLGRLRREQGRAAPHEAHLGRGARARTASASCRSIPGDMDTPLHALAVPDADPRDAEAARRGRASDRRCDRRGAAHATSGDRPGSATSRRRAMIAADRAVQRPARRAAARRRCRRAASTHVPRAAARRLAAAGRSGVANDAATLPASLAGMHVPTGAAIEVRLAGAALARRRRSPPAFGAVVFGAGDFRTRTEDRPPPPPLAAGRPPGARAAHGDRRAACSTIRGSFVAALRRHRRRGLGRPRAPRPADPVRARAEPLALWDVWTPIAGAAGRVRAAVGRLRARLADARRAAQPRHRLRDAHARGRHLVDRRSRARPASAASTSRIAFPSDRVAPSATRAARRPRSSRSARPSCARSSTRRAAAGGRAGAGNGGDAAHRRSDSRLRVVDAIVTGTHEPGTSHYELLRAFVGRRDCWPTQTRRSSARLSHARVRRLGAGICRRAPATAARLALQAPPAQHERVQYRDALWALFKLPDAPDRRARDHCPSLNAFMLRRRRLPEARRAAVASARRQIPASNRRTRASGKPSRSSARVASASTRSPTNARSSS